MVGHSTFDGYKFIPDWLHPAPYMAATEQDASAIYGPICPCSSSHDGFHRRILDVEPLVLDVDTVFGLDGDW